MGRQLIITLEEDVYEGLCRAVGSPDAIRCSAFISEMLRQRVFLANAAGEADAARETSSQDNPQEAQARAYLKSIYQSGMLEEARKSGDAPQWVEAAYLAMAAGDEWEGSALEILDLGCQEMMADVEREYETEDWLEGLAGDTLPDGDYSDEAR